MRSDRFTVASLQIIDPQHPEFTAVARSLLLLLSLLFPRAMRADPGAEVDALESDERRTIELFNGRDLEGWYPFLRDGGEVEAASVFSVRDGTIRISGEHLGYLSTHRSFRDYRLTLEFRWGSRNWGDRVGKARDSGIFLHSRGPDGNSYDANGAYKAAIECQVMEGAVGDLLLIRGRDEQNRPILPRLRVRADSERDADGWPYFDPDGTEVELRGFGRVNRLRKGRDWQDRFGFDDPAAIERPAGQWNHIECVCIGSTVRVHVNGVLVNRATNVFPDSGPILLQSEGSEVFFRKLRIVPVP